jgi:hypothetical protein
VVPQHQSLARLRRALPIDACERVEVTGEDEHSFIRMFRSMPNDAQFVDRRADEVVTEQEAAGIWVRRWDEDRQSEALWTLDLRSDGRLNLWVRGGDVIWASWF